MIFTRQIFRVLFFASPFFSLFSFFFFFFSLRRLILPGGKTRPLGTSGGNSFVLSFILFIRWRESRAIYRGNYNRGLKFRRVPAWPAFTRDTQPATAGISLFRSRGKTKWPLPLRPEKFQTAVARRPVVTMPPAVEFLSFCLEAQRVLPSVEKISTSPSGELVSTCFNSFLTPELPKWPKPGPIYNFLYFWKFYVFATV